MLLYKYMKREHATALVERGAVRVGTLHEYFRIDKLGEEVGDKEEGMAFCRIAREELAGIAMDVSPRGPRAEWVRGMVRKSPEARLFGQFFANYMPVDQYMYCLSDQFSAQIMRVLDYEACVRIHDVQRFFLTLSESIAERAKPVGMFFCQYRERGFTYADADEVYPEIIKTPKYAYQREVRVLWHSTAPWSDTYDVDTNPAPALEPLFVSDARLTAYCTMIA